MGNIMRIMIPQFFDPVRQVFIAFRINRIRLQHIIRKFQDIRYTVCTATVRTDIFILQQQQFPQRMACSPARKTIIAVIDDASRF